MSKGTKYDFLIVGQGLAGTLLAWFLEKRGKSFLVIDNNHEQAASKIAAGVINPITGRKYVKSWRIEEFLPFARKTYDEISIHLDRNVSQEKLIFRGLYSITDENTWEARKADPIAGKFIADCPNPTEYEGKINGIMAYGVLQGGLQVKLPVIIDAYRKYLAEKDLIINAPFEYDEIEFKEGSVIYKGLEVKKIIFAEGFQVQNNPFFNHLPFEAAKGDVLIIKIKGRPFDNILRHKLFIAPIDEEHYWIGSDYRWKFDDDQPEAFMKSRIVETLDAILKVPYEIIDHIAGIRPCVKGRKPFLGVHSNFDQLIIFNGLGTKGASLGPFWANHLISHLLDDMDLDEAVDIRRFLD